MPSRYFYSNYEKMFMWCFISWWYESCCLPSNLPEQVRHLIDTLKTYEVSVLFCYSAFEYAVSYKYRWWNLGVIVILFPPCFAIGHWLWWGLETVDHSNWDEWHLRLLQRQGITYKAVSLANYRQEIFLQYWQVLFTMSKQKLEEA